jgi:hypothetical protein
MVHTIERKHKRSITNYLSTLVGLAKIASPALSITGKIIFIIMIIHRLQIKHNFLRFKTDINSIIHVLIFFVYRQSLLHNKIKHEVAKTACN